MHKYLLVFTNVFGLPLTLTMHMVHIHDIGNQPAMEYSDKLFSLNFPNNQLFIIACFVVYNVTTYTSANIVPVHNQIMVPYIGSSHLILDG